jgi:hypothetical protein
VKGHEDNDSLVETIRLYNIVCNGVGKMLKVKLGLSRKKKLPALYILGRVYLPHKALSLLWNFRWLNEIEHNKEYTILEDKERKRYIEVPCDTLNNIVGNRKIAFAKIDVQGAEVHVLDGGVRFLETTRKLVVETHDHYDEKKRTFPKVIKMLKKSGYETRLTMGYIVHAWK